MQSASLKGSVCAVTAVIVWLLTAWKDKQIFKTRGMGYAKRKRAKNKRIAYSIASS
jgi:hypothetical protein